MDMTGLSRGRIYQWLDGEPIPKPWLKFFQAKFPKLDWVALTGEEQYAPPTEPRRRKTDHAAST